MAAGPRQRPDGYPHPSSPAASAVMRANRRVDTTPEVLLRSALHRRGLRFRKDLAVVAAGVRVRPDIVFTAARVAVFVDGCFWHACPEHGTMPRSNVTYWRDKLARNRSRDERVTDALRSDGWAVVRIWEHVAVAAAVAEVERAVAEARAGRSDGTA